MFLLKKYIKIKLVQRFKLDFSVYISSMAFRNRKQRARGGRRRAVLPALARKLTQKDHSKQTLVQLSVNRARVRDCARVLGEARSI